MLKIGIDGRDLFRDEITGIGRFILNFLDGIKEGGGNYQYILFLNEKNYCDIEVPFIKKIVIKENSTLLWDQFLLPPSLKKERIDIFLSPYFKAPLFAPCKVIISVLDIIPFIIDPYKSLMKTRLNRVAIEIFSRKATKIITISNYSKEEITRYFRIPQEKIEVIYPGTGKGFTPIQNPDKISEVKNRYGISGEYILYVGNLKPHKNLIKLFQAYSLLSEKTQREFQLVIGGKKDENYDLLSKKAVEIGVEKKVIFTDFIPDRELPALYGGATAFVFPSLYEGFGLPVLEAMACGTPVICSNRTSLPEVVGDSGILVDPGSPEKIASAMESILSDQDLCSSLRLKGLERAKEFSLKKTVKRLLEVIESVVKE